MRRHRDEELAKARRKARAHRKHIRQLERCLKEWKLDTHYKEISQGILRSSIDRLTAENERLTYELQTALEDRDEQVADLENLLVSCGYFRLPIPRLDRDRVRT